MLSAWNSLTPFRIISFLVIFVVVNIIVFMTLFSPNEMMPPPENQVAKYLLGTKLGMVQFSCSRWLLEVFINNKPVACGRTVPIESFSKKPDNQIGLSVKFSRAKTDSLYTLMMMDPDAPNPDYPYDKCWLHWIIGNINGSGLRNGDLSTGETVVAYISPTPPKGSGPHRYFLFLSEQPYEKTVFNSLAYQKRPHFNPDKFIEQYNFSPAIGTSYFVTVNPK